MNSLTKVSLSEKYSCEVQRTHCCRGVTRSSNCEYTLPSEVRAAERHTSSRSTRNHDWDWPMGLQPLAVARDRNLVQPMLERLKERPWNGRFICRHDRRFGAQLDD